MMGKMGVSLQHQNKPFHMSYRRLLSIIFAVITVVNIISMVVATSLYLHRIGAKEQLEQSTRRSLTNRDAYSVVRFIQFTTLLIGIGVRLAGLLAIGIFGRQFSDTEFESSNRRESFLGCLCYTCAMIVLLAAYYVGIVRLTTFDLLLHYVLTIIGVVFVAFALQQSDTYSKQLNAQLTIV